MLKPVGPLPTTKNAQVTDRAAPRDYVHVISIARSTAVMMAAAQPALYRLADLMAPLDHLPHLTQDRLVAALRYLGHGLGEDLDAQTSMPLVQYLGPDAVAGRDRQILHRARERCPREVTVRNLQRVCHWNGVTAWGVRGTCDRLEAAGLLRPHPGVVRRPVTVWEVVAADGS